MAKILVVDDERDTRGLLVDILFDAGYDVIDGNNGRVAFEKACEESPDLIMLDVRMPVMDGFEVLRKLRENPSTKNMAVVMLTELPSTKAELPAWRLGVRHYITKPFERERVELAVKVALREAEAERGKLDEDDASTTWQGSTSTRNAMTEESRIRFRTGTQRLNQILGDGLPAGSLTLMEGTPQSGKSVLSQHIAYESLLEGHGVTFFASDSTPKGLVVQMGSIGLEVSGHVDSDSLRVFSLGASTGISKGCGPPRTWRWTSEAQTEW